MAGVKEEMIYTLQSKQKKYIYLDKNITIQNLFPQAHAIYIIRYDYDLNGREITVPDNCILQFEGGHLSNGILKGSDSKLIYDKPFLSNVVLKGDFETNNIPIDTEIFIDERYNGDRIKSMFCIRGKHEKIIFSKNTYTDVGTIELTRNIEIDFSGSILQMKIDSCGLPESFIYVSEKGETGDSFLEFFKLKNATIVGNEEFKYDGTMRPLSIHSGPRRRCIQLFKVDDVQIDNVNFDYVEVGTQGKYHLPLRQRYELSVVSIMYYNNAKVNGCILHDCSADNLICLVPNITKDNMAIISNCICYRNYTGLVLLHDGRCRVFNNICSDCNSSAMNLFCYDSEIFNNHFENTYTDCIDLSEVGRFLSHNVRIYGNTANRIADFCSVWGKDIFIYDNNIRCSTVDGFAVDTYMTFPPFTYNDSRNNDQNLSFISCFIMNNIIKGNIVRSTYNANTSVKNGNVIDSLIIEGNKCEKATIKTSHNCANPICITNVRKAIIRNNYIKGLGKVRGTSRYMSFWQLYETPTDSRFKSEIDISSNTFVFDRGFLDSSIMFSIGAEFDTGNSRLYKVTVNYSDNIVVSKGKNLYDFIKLGPGKTNLRINSYNNIGFKSF